MLGRMERPRPSALGCGIARLSESQADRLRCAPPYNWQYALRGCVAAAGQPARREDQGESIASLAVGSANKSWIALLPAGHAACGGTSHIASLL